MLVSPTGSESQKVFSSPKRLSSNGVAVPGMCASVARLDLPRCLFAGLLTADPRLVEALPDGPFPLF